MKDFASVIVAALAVASIASATTVYYAGLCGSFSNPTPNSTLSSTWNCPTATSLGDPDVVDAEFIVYNSDYSSGLASTVTTVTKWSLSGATFAFLSDTTTSTGGNNSSPAVSSDGFSLNPAFNFPPFILSGFYDAVSGSFGTPTVNWTNSATVGAAVQATGYAEVVYGSDGIPLPTPEPGSLSFMGAGLCMAYFLKWRASRPRNI